MWKRLLFSILFFGCAAFITADRLFGLTAEPPKTLTVPDLRGQRAETVGQYAWLEAETQYRYDPEIPEGIVISQSPAGGSTRKISSRKPRCGVLLTVSLGRELAEVPEVAGEDYRTAAAKLREAGFSVTEKTREGGTAGIVLASEPAAGEKTDAGARVVLTVGIGTPDKAVTVPDLCGLGREEALLRAFLAGLSVRDVTEENENGNDAPEGTVTRQSPAAGSLVRAGTEIRLSVGRRKTED